MNKKTSHKPRNLSKKYKIKWENLSCHNNAYKFIIYTSTFIIYNPLPKYSCMYSKIDRENWRYVPPEGVTYGREIQPIYCISIIIAALHAEIWTHETKWESKSRWHFQCTNSVHEIYYEESTGKDVLYCTGNVVLKCIVQYSTIWSISTGRRERK